MNVADLQEGRREISHIVKQFPYSSSTALLSLYYYWCFLSCNFGKFLLLQKGARC